MRKEPKTARIYARSARHTAPGEPGNIQDQLDLLRRHALEHGYVVFDEYVDNGASGNTLNRPGLNALLNATEGNHFDALLV